jgi:hypothetical protein
MSFEPNVATLSKSNPTKAFRYASRFFKIVNQDNPAWALSRIKNSKINLSDIPPAGCEAGPHSLSWYSSSAGCFNAQEHRTLPSSPEADVAAFSTLDSSGWVVSSFALRVFFAGTAAEVSLDLNVSFLEVDWVETRAFLLAGGGISGSASGCRLRVLDEVREASTAEAREDDDDMK